MVCNLVDAVLRRAQLSLTVALSALLLTAGLTGPLPSAASDDHPDLHKRENRLERAIAGKHADLDEVSAQLVRAHRRLEVAVGELTDAREYLAGVRAAVREAAAVEREMQERLRVAAEGLLEARDDLASARDDVLDNRAALAAYAVSHYQSSGSLSLGVAFNSTSPQEALDNLQAAETVLDKQSVTLQEFQATRVLLRLTAQRVETATHVVAVQRAAAARTLQAERDLKAQAAAAKETVASKVADLREVRGDMAAAKRVERQRLHTLKAERDKVQERLTRIAERRARQHARELARARSAGSSAGLDTEAGFLSVPVRGSYLTSAYGMRMHPILHVLKLHDGADFHANCGRAVHAAADGRVMSEYFNAGYGNRVLIDHGFVRGVSLSTSYNHLTSFAVGVGDHVDRGQLIGYSGTTGYSTACHLHFMVYVNGHTIDPARWL